MYITVNVTIKIYLTFANQLLIPCTLKVKGSLLFLGAHVPMTEEGHIVVNGILASCYASFHHDLAHIAMRPMQWYPEVIEWFFGVQNGSPGYVDVIKELGRLMLPIGSLI